MHQMLIHSKHHGDCIVLIDEEDRERVEAYKWYVNKPGYVTTIIAHPGGKRTGLKLHRFVMNAPDGVFVDHKFGNKLDNRKSELRLCCRSYNGANKRKAGHTYGVFPVSVSLQPRWWVNVGTNGEPGSYKGMFSDRNAALNCYNYHLQQTYGEFASLNPCVFMTEDEWQSKRVFKKPASQYTYVYASNRGGWVSEIHLRGQKGKIHVGRFETEIEASEAHNRYLDEHGLDYPRSQLRERKMPSQWVY